MPKKILVPTDFTEASNAALQEAAAVAKDCSAELVVLYADQFLPPIYAEMELPHKFADMSDHDKMEVVKTYLRQKVDAIVPHDVPVDPIVRIDAPVHAILNTAKEIDADWIIMGTHGRTGVSRALQGSVTEEVLRKTDRPVLAVHSAA